jgi:hypothetical protein
MSAVDRFMGLRSRSLSSGFSLDGLVEVRTAVLFALACGAEPPPRIGAGKHIGVGGICWRYMDRCPAKIDHFDFESHAIRQRLDSLSTTGIYLGRKVLSLVDQRMIDGLEWLVDWRKSDAQVIKAPLRWAHG